MLQKTDEAAPLLAVNNIEVIYNHVILVLKGVSVSVARGGIVALLGANGAGKTTTLKAISNLLRAERGEVTKGNIVFDDAEVQSLSPNELVRRGCIQVMEGRHCFGHLTIEENLNLVAGLYRLPEPRAKVAGTLESLGLTSRRNQLAGSLSGGWKQRLALAACIMHAPQLLLLDEPTAGVDPKARREFWDEIHALTAGGMTVLVSTHYMDEAERCHRINYISYGRLIAQGTVAEVVAEAGLVTRVVTGPGLEAIAERLRGTPGVDQVAAFGASLHVVGRDPAALDAALAGIERAGVKVAPAETSLEDVFIQFMSASRDNMA